MKARANSAPLVITAVLLSLAISPRAVNAETVWFYGAPFDLAIPAGPEETKGWMSDAVLEVPDHFLIEDLDVSVGLTHTSVFDLRLSLTSPAGTTVLLNSYDPFTGYFEGENYRQTVFDDEATVAIADAAPPFEGRFRPIAGSALSAFDGEDAFGTWRLRIYDAHEFDAGRLEVFGLTMTTPEPATAVILLVGLTLAGCSGCRRS